MDGDAYRMSYFSSGSSNILIGGIHSENILAGDATQMLGSAGPIGSGGARNVVTVGDDSYNVLYGAAQSMSGGALTDGNVVTGGVNSTNYEYGDAQTGQ